MIAGEQISKIERVIDALETATDVELLQSLSGEFYSLMRASAPKLIARVRKLEAERDAAIQKGREIERIEADLLLERKVEAAAIAIFTSFKANSLEYWTRSEYEYKSRFRRQARAALLAAEGVK